ARDQRVQIRWIAVAPHFDLERALISSVLIAIDRVAHHPQVLPELVLALPGNRLSCCRNRHPHQNRQDCGRHDQLDQREAALLSGQEPSPSDVDRLHKSVLSSQFSVKPPQFSQRTENWELRTSY